MVCCKNPFPKCVFDAWGRFSAGGGPRPGRAPSFSTGYFLETRTRILVAPTFKEKLSLQASRAFPEGAPRKVSMFKIYLAGRSSDMSISCPETIFFSPKWQDSGCGFFRVLTFQEHKLLTCQEPGSSPRQLSRKSCPPRPPDRSQKVPLESYHV